MKLVGRRVGADPGVDLLAAAAKKNVIGHDRPPSSDLATAASRSGVPRRRRRRLHGEGRIDGLGRVTVSGQTLTAERIVVATGSDARIPPVEGLAEAGYWTNREATTLTEVPESIVILGGGPVGVELGQFMRRFGARVTLVQHGERLIAREEPVVGELEQTLQDDGIELRLGARAVRVQRKDGERVVQLDDGEDISDVSCWSRPAARRGCTASAWRASASLPTLQA